MDPTASNHPAAMHGARMQQAPDARHAHAGRDAGIALPFRGQSAPVVPTAEELAVLPEGPCRAVALRSRMMRSVTTFAQPQPHASLGLPAYLQFTSPIRRYVDLLSHFQLKVRGGGWPPGMQRASNGHPCGMCRAWGCQAKHGPGCRTWPRVPRRRTCWVGVWLGGG